MYGELQLLCDSQGITMSSYVDDLTFSGPLVNQLFERNVKRIVSNAGLTIHPDKTRLYRRDEPKLITGVIVRADRIDVKNKHHKAIYTLFNEIKSADNDKELKAIHEELLGRLNAAGQIDPAFKQRAKTLVSQGS